MSNRNPRKVYVSNISRDVRERDLGHLFDEVGKISKLQFKNRFAFIEYERNRDCDDAVHKFDGFYFRGRRLRVEQYCYRGGDRKYRSDNYSNDFRVYITNLDSMTSWQDLKDFGRTAGKSVTFADVRVSRDGDDDNGHKSELEGIVEYSDIRDYENALKELDGARLNGVRVKVYSKSSYDRNKFADDGGRSRSRSRSRSRDRRRKHSLSRSPKREHYDEDDGARVGGNRSRSRSRSRHNYSDRKSSASRSPSRSRSASRSQSRSPSHSPHGKTHRVKAKKEEKKTLIKNEDDANGKVKDSKKNIKTYSKHSPSRSRSNSGK